MDMSLEDVSRVPETARVLSLSTRCSVFMKSDCTHRLNKREATKDDIVLSLSNVMAGKVVDFLKRAKVRFFEAREGSVVAGRRYILGVDGGSTTTKVALLDTETDEVVASYYGRTHGDPVKALKECLVSIRDKIAADTHGGTVNIELAASTGSSREIIGVFLETPGVYNEIIAHSVGTAYFDPGVETIFEIGGQDAKYVLLKNGVPID
jgi:activator of 2-hydroxyglutaryl-CoA dehydratase